MIEFTKQEKEALQVVENYKENGILWKLKKVEKLLWMGFIACIILGFYLQYSNKPGGSRIAFNWMQTFALLSVVNFITNFYTIIQKQQKRISELESQRK